MKYFGNKKTSIETKLINSYSDANKFKREVRSLKKLMKEDKDFTILYNIYDELSTPQNYDKETANLLIDEAINFAKSIKVSKNLILEKEAESVENRYADIDILLFSNKKNIKEFVEARKKILDGICSAPKEKNKAPNIPITLLKKIANKKINEAIGVLDEEEKKIVKDIVSLTKGELLENFSQLKSITLEKLKNKLNNENNPVVINEIMTASEKIKNEAVSYLTYFKLKTLSESI